jgi:hypothetical protein
MPTRVAGFVINQSTGTVVPSATVTPRATDGSTGTTGLTDAAGFVAIAGLANKTWVGTVASAGQVFVPVAPTEQFVSDDLHNQSNTGAAHDFSQLRGKVTAPQVNSQTASPSTVLTADGVGNATWAAGGGGSPGGSSTQLQYNNAGAFGGTSGLTWDGTNLFFTGSQQLQFRSSLLKLYSSVVNTLDLISTALLNYVADQHLFYDDGNGAKLLELVNWGANGDNYLQIKNANTVATVGTVPIAFVGAAATGHLNMIPKGAAGRLQSNAVNVALVSDTLAVFAATTSTQLAGVISDATGSGLLVFSTNPVLTTPNIGTPSAGVLTNCTGLPVTGGGTGAATFTDGGVLVGNGTGAIQVTTVGTAGQLLKSGGAGVDPTFADNLATITFIIDGSGSVITTGIKGDLEIPFACTINRVTMLADQSGSIVVDLWKDTYANYPPTVADTITAAAKPTITTATKSQDATLTGWTTSIAAGDTLRFNVDSVTTIQRVTISLKVTKT